MGNKFEICIENENEIKDIPNFEPGDGHDILAGLQTHDLDLGRGEASTHHKTQHGGSDNPFGAGASRGDSGERATRAFRAVLETPQDL